MSTAKVNQVPKRPKQVSTISAENNAPAPTRNNEEATALLQSHGLQVKRVEWQGEGTGNVAQWRKNPTDDDKANAEALVPGIAHAF